jgi:hypothetical protein
MTTEYKPLDVVVKVEEAPLNNVVPLSQERKVYIPPAGLAFKIPVD